MFKELPEFDTRSSAHFEADVLKPQRPGRELFGVIAGFLLIPDSWKWTPAGRWSSAGRRGASEVYRAARKLGARVSAARAASQ